MPEESLRPGKKFCRKILSRTKLKDKGQLKMEEHVLRARHASQAAQTLTATVSNKIGRLITPIGGDQGPCPPQDQTTLTWLPRIEPLVRLVRVRRVL